MAMEVPKTRTISLEAQHRPRTLPELERVLDQRRSEVLCSAVGDVVVRATPVRAELDTFVVVVADNALLAGATVKDGSAPVREHETIDPIKTAPVRSMRMGDRDGGVKV